jgi:anti-anti-sigma factor
MGQLRSALSTALLQGCDPAESLELLDRFAVRLPGALASTAACLVVDAASGTIRWSRAGHLPPLLVGVDGSSRLLEHAGSGAVLGAPGRAPYSVGVVDVRPGDTLVLYTDGLAERRGELLDEGLDRIRAVAGRHASADPQRLTEMLLVEVLAGTAQPDDVAVIAARLMPAPLEERLPADPARLGGVRREVRVWSTAAGLTEDAAEDLQLALGEALANAVEHAYGSAGDGECTYRVARESDGSVAVRVRDGGTWRPPPADKGHRGRGLELISALAVDVEVAHEPESGSGTVVSFRVPASAPEAADATSGDGRPPRQARDEGAAGWGEEPARVVAEDDGASLRLSVVGELDLATSPAVHGQLISHLDELEPGSAAVLDLQPTTYLASAGVGMVLQVLEQAAERSLRLWVHTAPGTPPARVLELAGLAGRLLDHAARTSQARIR